jgi:hypothetical protein
VLLIVGIESKTLKNNDKAKRALEAGKKYVTPKTELEKDILKSLNGI